MNKKVAIYSITNLLDNKQYIGITVNLERRWKRHKKEIRSNNYLHRSLQLHGIDNFKFEHIANAFSWDDAKELEKFLIKEHNTLAPEGYNLTIGGDGVLGYKHTEKHKLWLKNNNPANTVEARQKRTGTKSGRFKGVIDTQRRSYCNNSIKIQRQIIKCTRCHF